MKKVAIITRTKNRPLMLPRVRASIEAQNFKDFIWVIVNDAGNKQAVDQCAQQAKINNINVKVIHRQHSIGMEAASNDAILHCESEYIVIHDDDDSWHADFLQKTVSFLNQKPTFVGVVTRSDQIFEDIISNEIIYRTKRPYHSEVHSIHLSDMARGNLFAPIAFLFRRSVYQQINGFDESLPVLGDWDFALRVLLQADIGFITETLANYHIRKSVDDQYIAYGNTVSIALSQHLKHETIYINKQIRQDINSGKPGLGTLLSNARQLHFYARNSGFLILFGKRLIEKYSLLYALKKWIFNG